MTTTPRLGITELASSQAVPEQTVNAALRMLEQGAMVFVVKDKDLTAPPGSPAQGDSYIVAASPTGAWTGWAGRIAFYQNTAWVPIVLGEGNRAYVQDENLWYQHDGSVWVAEAFLTALTITVSTEAGTSYTADLADANTRIRFTSASPITFTVPPNASVAFPIGTFIEFEQAGGGAVTATAGVGVTITNRAGFDVTAGQYAVAGLRKVATNEWSLTGDLT